MPLDLFSMMLRVALWLLLIACEFHTTVAINDDQDDVQPASFENMPDELLDRILSETQISDTPSLSVASRVALSRLRQDPDYDDALLRRALALSRNDADLALVQSVENGAIRAVHLLLNYGASASAYDHQSLIVAALKGYWDIFQLLLQHESAQPIPGWDERLLRAIRGDLTLLQSGNDVHAVIKYLTLNDMSAVRSLVKTIKPSNANPEIVWRMISGLAVQGRLDLLNALAIRHVSVQNVHGPLLNTIAADLHHPIFRGRAELLRQTLALLDLRLLLHLMGQLTNDDIFIGQAVVHSFARRASEARSRALMATLMASRGLFNIMPTMLRYMDTVSDNLMTSALRGGNVEIVKLLVDHGGVLPTTAANLAAQMGHVELWFYLVTAKKMIFRVADLTSEQNDLTKVASFWKSVFAKEDYLDALKRNPDFLSALLYAVILTDRDATRKLLEWGANPNSFDGMVIDAAITARDEVILRWLVERGGIIECNLIFDNDESDVEDTLFFLRTGVMKLDEVLRCYRQQSEQLHESDPSFIAQVLRHGTISDPTQALLLFIDYPAEFHVVFWHLITTHSPVNFYQVFHDIAVSELVLSSPFLQQVVNDYWNSGLFHRDPRLLQIVAQSNRLRTYFS